MRGNIINPELVIPAITGESLDDLYEAVAPTVGEVGQTVYARKDGAPIIVDSHAFSSAALFECDICCVYVGVISRASHLDIRLYTNRLEQDVQVSCFFLGTRVTFDEEGLWQYRVFDTRQELSDHLESVVPNEKEESMLAYNQDVTEEHETINVFCTRILVDLQDCLLGTPTIDPTTDHVTDDGVYKKQKWIRWRNNHVCVNLFVCCNETRIACDAFHGEITIKHNDDFLLRLRSALSPPNVTGFLPAPITDLTHPAGEWSCLYKERSDHLYCFVSTVASQSVDQNQSPFTSDITYKQYCDGDVPQSYCQFQGLVTCSCEIPHVSPFECQESDLVMEVEGIALTNHEQAFASTSPDIRHVLLKRQTLDEGPTIRFEFESSVSLWCALCCIAKFFAQKADAEFLQQHEAWGIDCVPDQESIGIILLAARYLRLTHAAVADDTMSLTLQEM